MLSILASAEKKKGKFDSKLKNAIQILESNPSISIHAAAASVEICHKVLKRNYSQFLDAGCSIKDWVPGLHMGHPLLLSDALKHVLKLYILSLD